MLIMPMGKMEMFMNILYVSSERSEKSNNEPDWTKAEGNLPSEKGEEKTSAEKAVPLEISSLLKVMCTNY